MTKTPKAEQTRRHILDTGQTLILSKGFSALGLSELLKVCEVPKGSFYHYFPSKEQFGTELLTDYITFYLDRFDRLTAGEDDARTRLIRYFSAWIEASGEEEGMARRCLLVKLAAEVSDLSEDMRLVLKGGMQAVLERIGALLDEGRNDGSLPSDLDVEATARTLYQVWLGAALMAKVVAGMDPLRHALSATRSLLPAR
ncbi:TetR/AcrR family transcriptional regulator [Rhizobium alvei]|uniref:TetR/AcrR family transcriptional regulator n=1 Tax=Rhizobium alvei TaxID=1132659 RepID=A0ABT8YIR1_9HYPH|nr:TetR/AcrR family transcriptional regulator [Rhizobium alvei]MDO6963174.1 TetR/AcrR family transcriptional regulator [Rhizobium alvei]